MPQPLATTDRAGSTKPARLVVFTSNLSYSVRKGIVDIDERIAGLTWLVLLHEPRKRGLRQLLASQWRNLRKHGWRWIPYEVGDIWDRIFHAPVPRRPGGGPGAEYTLEALRARPNVRIVRTENLHDDASIAEARRFAPDLGLSIAAPILARSMFSVPRLGTINLHKGKLPEFRGMPPAFWELWHDQQSVGCSVHWVDDKLDTGQVVAETRIDRAAFSSVRGLQLGLDELGADLMSRAVAEILGGTAVARPQREGAGRTFRKPTLYQEAVLAQRLRLGFAQKVPPHKNSAKEAVAGLAWHGWHLGAGRLLAPRITVLLYHRVSDEVRDNLTVGIEQFDRQMALLSQHCELLSIEQVLATTKVRHSGRPLVAVTFDDGYADNHDHAAPILRRHGVPAAFFVSTGVIERAGRFPHDLARGNPPIPVMTWDQLREMQAWGFSIGSHTVEHIDCATEPEALVRSELARSRDDLKRELGQTAPIFAYPYGGRRHMTPARLQLVREAGYVGCLSAYGGSNVVGVDPFNVLRRPIHWRFSDRALLLSALGVA